MQNALLFDSKENLWYGSIDGLIKLNTKKLQRNNIKPGVFVLDIRGMSASFNQHSYSYPKIKSLPHDHNYIFDYDFNSISISYVGISLTNPDRVKYSYKLSGTNWIENTSETTVRFPNLDPGEYTFEVKAQNSFGNWTNPPKRINFTIQTPFYKTYLFYLLIFILAAIIMFYIYRLKVLSVKKKNLELEERIAERIIHEKQLKES